MSFILGKVPLQEAWAACWELNSAVSDAIGRSVPRFLLITYRNFQGAANYAMAFRLVVRTPAGSPSQLAQRRIRVALLRELKAKCYTRVGVQPL